MAYGRQAWRRIAGLICVAAAWCVPAQKAAAAPETELVFAGWGGTLGQALKSAVIPAFEQRHGVKVVYLTQETVNMVARLKAQAAHPQVDVMAGTDASHSIGRREGLFEKLDPAAFTEFPNLYPFAISPDGTGVMFGIQSLAMEYNVKLFQEKGWPPPSSWYDLWDPKYQGHVVLYNPPSGYAVTFLGLLAVLQGGASDRLEPAWAKLPGLVPNALTFVDPSAQLDVLFSTGGAWIAFNGSGRIGALAASGVPVAMAMPEEGGALNPNYLDIIKGAPHPALARAFVDYMLSPEAQALIAKTMLLGPVNRKVALDEDLAAKVPFGADVVARLRVIDSDPINDNMAAVVQRWNKMIAR